LRSYDIYCQGNANTKTQAGEQNIGKIYRKIRIFFFAEKNSRKVGGKQNIVCNPTLEKILQTR